MILDDDEPKLRSSLVKCSECGKVIKRDNTVVHEDGDPLDDILICRKCHGSHSRCDRCGVLLGDEDIDNEEYGKYCQNCY